MITAYIQSVGGASGDMLLGAVLDAGLPLESIKHAVAALKIPGVQLATADETRCEVRGCRALVDTSESPLYTPRQMLDAVADADKLSETTRRRSTAVLKALFAAEARVHGSNPDQIHLHELGTADTLVDVVGVVHGLEQLGVERICASPLVLGEATGPRRPNGYSNPAPATLEIIAAAQAPIAPERPFHANVGELTTPTGAALITTLADEYRQPAMTLHRIGVGIGGKNPPAFPNVLRLWLGQTTAPVIASAARQSRTEANPTQTPPPHSAHADASPSPQPAHSETNPTPQPAHGEPVEPRADANPTRAPSSQSAHSNPLPSPQPAHAETNPPPHPAHGEPVEPRADANPTQPPSSQSAHSDPLPSPQPAHQPPSHQSAHGEPVEPRADANPTQPPSHQPAHSETNPTPQSAHGEPVEPRADANPTQPPSPQPAHAETNPTPQPAHGEPVEPRANSSPPPTLETVRTAAIEAYQNHQAANPSPAPEPNAPFARWQDNIIILETNIDNATGEQLGFAMDQLFAAGALDVWHTPIQMKKNRPAILLSALAPAHLETQLAEAILRHTPTLGVRVRPVGRYAAHRDTITVKTQYGPIRIKRKWLSGQIATISPEHDDLAAATDIHHIA